MANSSTLFPQHSSRIQGINLLEHDLELGPGLSIRQLLLITNVRIGEKEQHKKQARAAKDRTPRKHSMALNKCSASPHRHCRNISLVDVKTSRRLLPLSFLFFQAQLSVSGLAFGFNPTPRICLISPSLFQGRKCKPKHRPIATPPCGRCARNCSLRMLSSLSSLELKKPNWRASSESPMILHGAQKKRLSKEIPSLRVCVVGSMFLYKKLP